MSKNLFIPQNTTNGKGSLIVFTLPANQDPRMFDPAGHLIGNTTAIANSSDTEKLEHFDESSGFKNKDLSRIIQINRSVKITTDHISPENIAYVMLGKSKPELRPASTTPTTEYIKVSALDRAFQLGFATTRTGDSPLNPGPRGLQAITLVGVSVATGDGDTTPYAKGADLLTKNTDFYIDEGAGIFQPALGGVISVDSVVAVEYTLRAQDQQIIVSSEDQATVRLMYVPDNPFGENYGFIVPKAAVHPDGDFNMKGSDFQEISLMFEVLDPKVPGWSAIQYLTLPVNNS